MAHWREMVMLFRWNVTVKSMAKGDRQRAYDVIVQGVCASDVALQKRQVLQIWSVIEALGIRDARHMRHIDVCDPVDSTVFFFPHYLTIGTIFENVMSTRLVFFLYNVCLKRFSFQVEISEI
jgi:hypothetical protein